MLVDASSATTYPFASSGIWGDLQGAVENKRPGKKALSTPPDRKGWLRTEKVAGSSPAERAPNSPANSGVLLFLEPLFVRVYHLSDHLRAAERAFQGPARVGLVPLNLSAKRPIASS